MDKCQIVRVETLDGRGERRSIVRLDDVTCLRIGRASDCELRLPEGQVALLHARLRFDADGSAWIENASGKLLLLDGIQIDERAQLHPGSRLEIGSHRLIVEALSGNSEFRMSISGPPQATAYVDNTHRRPRFERAARRYSIAAVVMVVALMFLLPWFGDHFLPADEGRNFSLRTVWKPGPQRGAHALVNARCDACHDHGFHAVSDDTCESCHENIGGHADARSWESIPIDQRHASSCKDCHRDHRSAAELRLAGDRSCLNCHSGMRDDTGKRVSAFPVGHPELRYLFDQGGHVSRITNAPGVTLREEPGLKFSHEVHLDADGVSSPEGRTVMKCSDCHRLADNGSFRKITMKEGCQQSRCHELTYLEPFGDPVPHGSVSKIMDKLNELYTQWLGEDKANREACGQGSKGGPDLARCADKLTKAAAAETLFRGEGEDLECGLCHEISPAGKASPYPWTVSLPRGPQKRLQSETFSHLRHNGVACADCHDKKDSRRSEDVSLPNLATCAQCHADGRGKRGKIASGCNDCHRFHHQDLAWKAPGAATSGNRR